MLQCTARGCCTGECCLWAPLSLIHFFSILTTTCDNAPNQPPATTARCCCKLSHQAAAAAASLAVSFQPEECNRNCLLRFGRRLLHTKIFFATNFFFPSILYTHILSRTTYMLWDYKTFYTTQQRGNVTMGTIFFVFWKGTRYYFSFISLLLYLYS